MSFLILHGLLYRLFILYKLFIGGAWLYRLHLASLSSARGYFYLCTWLLSLVYLATLSCALGYFGFLHLATLFAALTFRKFRFWPQSKFEHWKL